MTAPPATPRYPLWEVQASIATARIYSKSAREHVKALLACSDRDADRYIRRLIARLHESDFCRTVQLRTGGEFADEYGLENPDGRWYVKVFVKDGTHVVSCHPPERPMITVTGKRISP